jgi:hypothetical protein
VILHQCSHMHRGVMGLRLERCETLSATLAVTLPPTRVDVNNETFVERSPKKSLRPRPHLRERRAV